MGSPRGKKRADKAAAADAAAAAAAAGGAAAGEAGPASPSVASPVLNPLFATVSPQPAAPSPLGGGADKPPAAGLGKKAPVPNARLPTASPPPPPTNRDFASVSLALSTRDRTARLLSDGYLVVDGLLGGAWATALRTEVLSLAAAGVLGPNRTSFTDAKGKALVYSKPGVFEADLHSSDVRARIAATCPELAAWFGHSAVTLANGYAAAVPQLHLVAGEQGRSVKLQVATPGGAFPLHFDNPGPPSRRCLTLLLYLNPNWVKGQGGELVLQPFLQPALVVEPLHNRAVFFLSDRMLHRTLPSHAPQRLCVTTWFDGSACNSEADVKMRLPATALKDVPATAALLRGSACQRSISRAVYAEEYEESMRACMRGASGEEQLLAAHEARLMQVAVNEPLALLVAKLAQLKT